MDIIKEAAIPPPTATPAATPTTGTTVTPARAKVATSFIADAKDVQLVAISGKILAALTGNASFTTPVPTLATLQSARNTYVAAVNALDRGSTSIAARNQSRLALGQVLRELALYVQQTCQGDMVVLISSGYPAQRGRGPLVLTVPPPPEVVKLGRGPASGQISVRCKTVAGALLYQCRYATALAPTVWTLSDTSSSSGMLLAGMVPTTEYLVQGRAYGKRGCSDWTDSATVIAT